MGMKGVVFRLRLAQQVPLISMASSIAQINSMENVKIKIENIIIYA